MLNFTQIICFCTVRQMYIFNNFLWQSLYIVGEFICRRSDPQIPRQEWSSFLIYIKVPVHFVTARTKCLEKGYKASWINFTFPFQRRFFSKKCWTSQLLFLQLLPRLFLFILSFTKSQIGANMAATELLSEWMWKYWLITFQLKDKNEN